MVKKKLYQDKKYAQVGKDVVGILNLVGNAEHWCRRAMVRDKEGEQLFDPSDPRAIQYCILGAFYAIEGHNDTLTFLQLNAKKQGFISLTELNDFSDHSFIVDFLVAILKFLGYNVSFIEKEKK
jgi:hypothetical protein